MKVDTAGRTWITTRELQDVMFGNKVPEIEQWRRYYGKNVNTAIIEQTLCQAYLGFMRDLIDLGAETIRTDPHLAGTVTKRMRAVGSIKPRVVPVTGDGIDPKLADHYADMVRRQLESIPRLRQKQVNLAWSAWSARSALEIEYIETSNPRERWRAKDLHWIHPRRLSLGPERELRINDGLYQGMGFEKLGFDLRELPFKFITSRRQLFNEYPEREGLIIPALFYSYFKRLDWRERLALMELYGKPMRWVEVAENATVTEDQLADARDSADDMGSDAAGAFPPGVKFLAQAVGQGASAIHKEIIEDCNSELSKLVLGSTNTTDSQPSGLGSGQAYVHQDGETLVFTSDCDDNADDWTEGFAKAIVLLNGGPDHAEVYTPRIELPYEAPPSADEEITRAQNTLNLGIPLKRDEVYERSGFTKPEDGDAIIEPPEPGGGGGPLEGLFKQLPTQASVNPSDTSDQNKEIEPKKIAFSSWRPGRVFLSTTSTKVMVQGIPVHIDRPKGFIQQGTDPEGRPWTRTYQCDYGFIPNTLGGDGEGLDVFLGPDLECPTVYWVTQKTFDGEFDEYKLFVGFSSATAALDTYGEHIPTELFGGVETTTTDQVKALLGVEPAPRLRGDPLQVERAAKVLGLISMIHAPEE